MDWHGLAGGNVFSRKIEWDRYFYQFYIYLWQQSVVPVQILCRSLSFGHDKGQARSRDMHFPNKWKVDRSLGLTRWQILLSHHWHVSSIQVFTQGSKSPFLSPLNFILQHCYIAATAVVPSGSHLDILKNPHPQRSSSTTHSRSNRECSLFASFPPSHPLMLFLGKGNSCPAWQEIFWLRLCRSTLWVLSTKHLFPSTH